jgi:hypothetical protein
MRYDDDSEIINIGDKMEKDELYQKGVNDIKNGNNIVQNKTDDLKNESNNYFNDREDSFLEPVSPLHSDTTTPAVDAPPHSYSSFTIDLLDRPNKQNALEMVRTLQFWNENEQDENDSVFVNDDDVTNTTNSDMLSQASAGVDGQSPAIRAVGLRGKKVSYALRDALKAVLSNKDDNELLETLSFLKQEEKIKAREGNEEEEVVDERDGVYGFGLYSKKKNDKSEGEDDDVDVEKKKRKREKEDENDNGEKAKKKDGRRIEDWSDPSLWNSLAESTEKRVIKEKIVTKGKKELTSKEKEDEEDDVGGIIDGKSLGKKKIDFLNFKLKLDKSLLMSKAQSRILLFGGIL